MSGPSRGSVWGDPPGQPPLQEPGEYVPVRSISGGQGDFLRLWKGAISSSTRMHPEANAELTQCSLTHGCSVPQLSLDSTNQKRDSTYFKHDFKCN